MDKKISVVISGSFRRHYVEIKVAIKTFESLGITVLSPRASEIINPGEDVAVLATDDTKDPKTLEERHLDAIYAADALYFCNPGGYLGASATLELGWAIALGKPIFSSDEPADAMLKHFSGNVTKPEQAKEELTRQSPLQVLNKKVSLATLQRYVREMVRRRGFDQESSQDLLLLLIEEVGELAKAMRKSIGIKTDQNKAYLYNTQEELADIFIYLLDLANTLNISLFDAFYAKEIENEKRQWN